MTYVVPIYEGVACPTAIDRLDIGRKDLFLFKNITKYVVILLLMLFLCKIFFFVLISSGGKDLTSYMNQILMWRGYSLTTRCERMTVKSIKETQDMCYMSLDYNAELEKASITSEVDKVYELPDGQEIVIKNERFRCPEVLFNPCLMGKQNDEPLAYLVDKSIRRCEICIR